MTTLDARTSIAGFDMSNGTLVNFNSYILSNNEFYAWETSASGTDPTNKVYAFGSGITVDGSGNPTGGSITSLKLDLEGDGDLGTDADVDGFITLSAAVPLTDMWSPSGTDVQVAADKFWTAILSGDDTITAPDVGLSLMFGDFLQITATPFEQEERTGGNDTISANVTSADATHVIGARGSSAEALVGDAYLVSGAEFHDFGYFGVLHGGNDHISLTGYAGYALVGDAYVVAEQGAVDGGDDTIHSDAITTLGAFAPRGSIAGDVFKNYSDVTGGADDITGSNYAFLDEMIAGDTFLELGSTQGGKDTIHARAGHDYIAGDVALDVNTVIGGADKLYGGEDADIISGDVLQAGDDGPFGSVGGGNSVPVQITGGNDTIHGDQGNDILAGDIFSFGKVAAGDSHIGGGNDTLFGDDGDDALYGDWGPGSLLVGEGFFDDGGDDTLTGGAGNDSQYGESGNDVFIVQHAADSVGELISGGDGTDRIRFTSTTTGETLVLSNKVTTVEIAEIANASGAVTGTTALNINAAHVGYGLTLRGNAGANTLTGTAFDDTLNGGGGKDMLNGGAGADHFIYGNAANSTSTGYDTINKANFAADIWDVQGPIEAIDAKITTGALSAGNFDTQLAAAVNDAHLGARHAVLFTPGSGGLAGKTFLIIDQNNDAGYQSGGDLVIMLTNAQHLGGIGVADFI